MRWRGSVHLCIYQHSCCWNSTTSVVLAALNVPFLIPPSILACIVLLSLIANMNHWPKKTPKKSVYQTSSWKNTFMKIIRFFSYKHHHGYPWLDRKTTIGIKKFLLKRKESGKPEQGTHPCSTNFIIKHRGCLHMHMAYFVYHTSWYLCPVFHWQLGYLDMYQEKTSWLQNSNINWQQVFVTNECFRLLKRYCQIRFNIKVKVQWCSLVIFTLPLTTEFKHTNQNLESINLTLKSKESDVLRAEHRRKKGKWWKD